MLIAVIVKQIASVKDMGVIIHFSFLLVEKKFMTVFPKKKTAKNIHAILVALFDINTGSILPAARMIYNAKP